MSRHSELKTQDRRFQPVNGSIAQKDGVPMLLQRTREHIGQLGLLIRPARMDDLEAAHRLFDVCAHTMIGRSEATLDEVRTEWLLPDFDLASSTRVVEGPYGQLIGYVEVWDNNPLPVSVWVWGRVHPDFEGLGIGTELMNWAEQRARQAIDRVPPDLRVVIQAGTHSQYEPGHQLLKAQGMSLIRHFWTMAVDLDREPERVQWPAGIQVRNMTGIDQVPQVLHAVRDAFRDHWGYIEQPFEAELERWLHFLNHEEDFDPTLHFLAMDGDEIAGMSLCWPKTAGDPGMGWVSTLGVRRQWRRKGLGLALLHHSFGEFYRRGQRSVGLGVDSESLTGATRLYEKAGMRPIRQFDKYEKELRPGRDLSTQSVDYSAG